ncbi:uncharacterized protein LY89DRAFT_665492 [Mollisia scopiformis]|uniref:Uncharacterized protein n=1 Tax=Mollisia scopiformis TaxID=149040 RepID=A0A194XLB1_MOLSC|nr:uncharacterized protein LY89DRAFT_665492 [Mollisia scopiformis]KUJ21025.1 hypothetical protein LY89DRAFT_665492 [Mollisia scopiformis]
MSTFSNTGCSFRPFQLSSHCLTCSVITSNAEYTTMSGTSDFPASAYPEIDANTLAGPTAFVTTPKKVSRFQAFFEKPRAVTEPIILNTFTISRDFHPGQSRAEEESDYPEGFALDAEPITLRTFYISKDFHPGQSEEKDVPYTERFALDTEDEKAPKREAVKPQRKLRARRNAVAPLTVASKRATRNKKTEAKAQEESEESELEGDTIVVDCQSDSEDESPDPIQQARKRLQAAQDQLVLALLAEKSKKGIPARAQQASARATKDIDSEEESPRGTKRSRPTAESSDEEPLAKKTRSSKRAKASDSSNEEPPRRSSRSQTKKTKTNTVRRSLRIRSSVGGRE